MTPQPVQRLRVIASSSSGNAAFLRLGEQRLLLDAGVPIARIEAALSDIDERIEDLGAVLITHEHTDHIQGLAALHARRPDLPIYCTPGTARQLARRCGVTTTRDLLPNTPLQPLPGVTVTPFPTSHDAAQPVGLRLHTPTCALALATDLGTWDDATAQALQGCQLLLLEANYCPDLLAKSRYPTFLRRRIAGPRGHLSNKQSQRLLQRLLHPGLQHVLLAHLSEENNLPERALEIVSEALHPLPYTPPRLQAARRTLPSDPIDLPPLAQAPRLPPAPHAPPRQLSLF